MRTRLRLILVAALVPAAGIRAQEVPASALADHVAKNRDGAAPFSLDFSQFSGDTRDLPVGVFDSGIGGLTVLEAILSLDAFHNDSLKPGADGRPDFENERFIYFGDQANMPYGNYPAAGKTGFLRELILKDAVFLLGKRAFADAGTSTKPRDDKLPVKAIVIACNTATAYGLEDIRAAITEWRLNVPVIGVVEAGARGVNELMPADNPKAVAVLATVGTCASGAYPRAIGSTVGLAGKPAPLVVQQGCAGLAGAIEGDSAFVQSSSAASAATYQGPSTTSPSAPLDAANLDLYGFEPAGMLGDLSQPDSLRLNSVTNYVRYDVASLMQRHRATGSGVPVGAVVLGCTHFPLARQEIAAAFERLRTLEKDGARPFEHLIEPRLEFVNPAELTAKELFRTLASARLRLKPGESCRLDHDEFFFSVANPACKDARLAADGTLDKGYKYSRATGKLDLEDTINVPMRAENLPAASLNLVRTKLPEVWARLQRDAGEKSRP